MILDDWVSPPMITRCDRGSFNAVCLFQLALKCLCRLSSLPLQVGPSMRCSIQARQCIGAPSMPALVFLDPVRRFISLGRHCISLRFTLAAFRSARSYRWKRVGDMCCFGRGTTVPKAAATCSR